MRRAHVLECGRPDNLPKIRDFPEQRFRKLELQEASFAHVGMEVARGSVFSVTPKQGEFAQNVKPLPTSPQLWAARQQPLSIEDTKPCQCKPVELFG